MARVGATLPGYASVARASEVLHLAPRSVRDLIYAGRLPSLRIGRLHYIRAADLEVERRRRLGLPLPRRRQASASARQRKRQAAGAPRNHSLDAALRRQRAAERAELVTRWAQRHNLATAELPVHVLSVTDPITCEACSRVVRHGRFIEITSSESGQSRLCVTCGRRALLEWADRRRQEAAAARQMAQSLGEPEPVDGRPAEVLQQVLLPQSPAEEQPSTGPRAA
jgi:Helix-turn-helix domain